MNVIKNLPRKKSPHPDGLTGELFSNMREITLVLQKFFFKTVREGMLPNSFHEASITIFENLTKSSQDNSPCTQRHKSNKIGANLIQQHTKR